MPLLKVPAHIPSRVELRRAEGAVKGGVAELASQVEGEGVEVGEMSGAERAGDGGHGWGWLKKRSGMRNVDEHR